MKRLLRFAAGLIALVVIITCEKIEDTVLTKVLTVSVNPGTTSVTVVGKVVELSKKAHGDYGFCYGTAQNPQVADGNVTLGKPKTGEFTTTIDGLAMGQTYFIRAYCKEGNTYVYGENKTVTTSSVTVTTSNISTITRTNAVSGGTIAITGTIQIDARGVCWSTAENPKAKMSHTTDGTGVGTFTSSITGLSAATTYYARAYAITNPIDTIYGEQKTFITLANAVPTVTTSAISTFSYSTAAGGGEVTLDNGVAVTARGLCWSTTQNPTVADSKTIDGNGIGTFTSALTGLTPATTYYVRAYATNTVGTGYGLQINFTTLALAVPTLNTTAASSITQTSASSGGNITGDGGTAVSARGICWSTLDNPTLSDAHTTDATGTGSFTSSLTGLVPGTKYYVRAYATNSTGTAYGASVNFTTLPPNTIPIVTTSVISGITGISASSGGSISSDGGSPVIERGNCWGLLENPTTADTKVSNGTGIGSYSCDLTGLANGTLYHVRAYAINGMGIAYGADLSFTTFTAPILTTTAASAITATSATSGGNITSNGGTAVTARGVCWSTSINPTIALTTKTVDASGSGTFTSSITGLTGGTKYYVRAYATNIVGTTYGNEENFTTTSLTVTDFDGNIYNQVTIGTQTWLKENLKVTHYRNGDVIANVTDNTAWSTQNSGAYSWYNNDEATNKPLYGALYNYYTTVDNRNLCPTGWHVATDTEWKTMEIYLGMTQAQADAVGTRGTDQGAQLKSTTGWYSNNYGTNTSGFSALPGGFRESSGVFSNVSYYGCWWSASLYGTSYAWYRSMNYNQGGVSHNSNPKTHGLSVRCLQGEGLVLPAITTTAGSAITSSTATSGGNITSDGGAAITARGVCWSTTTNPTVALSTKTVDAGTTGTYTSSIIGLTGGTIYYVRAYATNSVGTAYGNEVIFTSKVNGVQTRLNSGQTPLEIVNSGVIVDSLYGMTYQGGLIFYLNTTTGGGLVSAPSDQSNISSWGCEGTLIVGADGLVVGTGAQNTVDIIAGCNTAGIAALICSSLSLNGYTDWFLPSTDELNAMYTNLYIKSIGGYSGGSYWSSSESSSTLGNSHWFSLNMRQGASKHLNYYVRAVRAFGNYGLPAISTVAATSITSTSASSGGNVISNGGNAITASGVCWSTSTNPTIALTTKTVDATTETFTSSITGLTPGTTYYLRAYATSSVGTAYGNEVSFITTALPTVTDYDGNIYNQVTIGTQTWLKENLKVTHYRNGNAIANVTDNTAWSTQSTGAYCWYNNDETTNKPIYGALYNYYTTIDNRNLCPTGWHVPSDLELKTLEMNLGMSQVDADNTNWRGTDQANQLKVSGTTYWQSGNAGTNSSGFTGLGAGSRNQSGVFGYIADRSTWWSTTENNAIGSWLRYLQSNIAQVARVNAEKTYGLSIRCLSGEGQVLPAITTTVASTVTSTTASSGGNVTSDGGTTVSARGVCWSTSTNPTIALTTKTLDAGTTGTYTSSLTGLTASTTYFVRAYATNSVGTVYGNEVSFTTNPTTVTDIDGNTYPVVQIGSQVWMAENLKTTKYRDGTSISNITDNTAWTGLSLGAFCWYDNNITNKNVYGGLYNYYSIIDSRGLCPLNWHIPTDSEFKILEMSLGMSQEQADAADWRGTDQGTQLKSTTGWSSGGSGNNSSGFNALPGGYRYHDGGYFYLSIQYGYWWSASEFDLNNAWYRVLIYNTPQVVRVNQDKRRGLSIRCVKD